MKNEIRLYRLIKMMSETMDDDMAASLLEWVDELVQGLRKTDSFKRVAGDVKERRVPIKAIRATALVLAVEHPELKADHEALVWIVGLRVAGCLNDFDHVLVETCLFIASQEADLCRVKDDRLRLALTYLHLTMLKSRA